MRSLPIQTYCNPSFSSYNNFVFLRRYHLCLNYSMQECYHCLSVQDMPLALPDSAAWISRIWKRLPCLCTYQTTAVSVVLIRTVTVPFAVNCAETYREFFIPTIFSGLDHFVVVKCLWAWLLTFCDIGEAGLLKLFWATRRRSSAEIPGTSTQISSKSKGLSHKKTELRDHSKVVRSERVLILFAIPSLGSLQFNKAFLIWRQLFLGYETWGRIERRKPGLLLHHVHCAFGPFRRLGYIIRTQHWEVHIPVSEKPPHAWQVTTALCQSRCQVRRVHVCSCRLMFH